MPCNHLGPIEIMQMAEEHLRNDGVPENQWGGLVFGWGEDVTGSQWTSVYTEIERRGESWVVTKIDRRTEPIGRDEGLTRVSSR
jgi:hypothetical protein